MSFAVKKITREFTALPMQEKIKFLKNVIASPPGEWIEHNGKLYFVPEGPPATKEEEEIFEIANKEINAGHGVSLDEFREEI
ncbi:MAG: hypothetical protein C4589_06925 [Peptococcaceae bacterium]|nr:MAG: hypothetical protein C4589_06925 [Peptococcaceae bacterium]